MAGQGSYVYAGRIKGARLLHGRGCFLQPSPPLVLTVHVEPLTPSEGEFVSNL